MRALTPAENSAAVTAAPSGQQPPVTNTVLRVSYQGFSLNSGATGPRVIQYVQLGDQSVAWREKSSGVEAGPEEDSGRRRQALREAKERQEAFLRQTPAGSGFLWLLERQIMFHDGRIYVNNGRTDTLPSHDLAHLLVGLCSNLPWCPTGSDTEVRVSEFNAAVLENLLTYTYQHIAQRSVRLEDILPKTLQYARWFVEKHYAPFPMPVEEACRRFCLGIDIDAVTDYSHYFVTQKESERQSTSRDGPWEMLLIRQPPEELSATIQQFQALIRSTLLSMKARPGATVAIDKPATIPGDASVAGNETSSAADLGRSDASEAEDARRRQDLHDARERQKDLLRRTPAGSGFSWLRERQIMFHRRRIYVHDGPTDTLPSHDLAHLLVGMGSNLPWCPTGPDAEVRVSEFNAAVLENLLSFTYEHVACRSVGLDEILPKTLQYARWFVEKHYAPFPMPLEEAYRRFCLGIDAEAITSLSHYFFTQKEREHHGIRRDGPWEMRLVRQPPAGLGTATRQFQALIHGALLSMRGVKSGAAAAV